MPTTIKTYHRLIIDRIPKPFMSASILLVDDELITLKITRKLLSSYGYNIEIATNTTEAIELLGSKYFDLAIIDINMPTLNGFDLVQLMHTFKIETPVLFLSNNTDIITIQESYDLGVKKFVSKEKEFNYLPQIVRQVLASA